MNDASSGQPDGDEDGYELGETNRTRCLQNVEVLEDVRDRHQSQGSEEPQSDPRPIEIYRHKGRWYRKVVHERIHLQHEPQLVTGGDKLRESYERRMCDLFVCFTCVIYLNHQLNKYYFSSESHFERFSQIQIKKNKE